MATEFKATRIIGNPNGTPKERVRWVKCQRSKHRNQQRKALRLSGPKYRGAKLHCWPLPTEPDAAILRRVQEAV